MSVISRTTLAPGLEISRVVTGLWQIADMERDGRTLDLDAAARAMAPYVEAGFTPFDMADHYGSAEVIAGSCSGARRSRAACSSSRSGCPKPGPVDAADVRAAVERVARAAAGPSHRPDAVPRLELRRPALARRALPPAGAAATRGSSATSG